MKMSPPWQLQATEKCDEDQHRCWFIMRPGNVNTNNTMMPPMPWCAMPLAATGFHATYMLPIRGIGLAAMTIDTRIPPITTHGEQYMPLMAWPWWHWAYGAPHLWAAWNWAAVVIDARHPAIAVTSMPPMLFPQCHAAHILQIPCHLWLGMPLGWTGMGCPWGSM
jgi:hypothetical protein